MGNSSEKRPKRSMMPGILLIVIGIWILSPHILPERVWERGYPFLILGVAAMMLTERGISHRDMVFWAVFLSCTGLFYLLRNFDFIPYFYLREYWPLFLIFIGLSSFVSLITGPHRITSLIPAGLFLFLGLFLFSYTASDFLEGFEIPFSLIGPLLLIAVGCQMVLSAFSFRKHG